MRSASEASIAELVALAKKDAKSYYKHAAAILVKQCQMRKPRDRVPIVFVMNKLASDKDDHESAKLYAGRFAPDIVACVESALSCPPKHMHGLRKVIDRWEKRRVFQHSIVQAVARAVNAHVPGAGGVSDDPSRDPSSDDLAGMGGDDDYVVSSDDEAPAEGDGRRAGGVIGGGTAGGDGPGAGPSVDVDVDVGVEVEPAAAPTRTAPAKARVNKWPARPPRPDPPPAVSAAEGPAAAASDALPPASNPPPPLPPGSVSYTHLTLPTIYSV